MSASEIYFDIVGIVLFLAALWAGGFAFRLLRLSPIVGEIAVGILLGPNLLDIVPLFQDGTCEENNSSLRVLSSNEFSSEFISPEESISESWDYTKIPMSFIRMLSGSSEEANVWVVLGQLGVTLLIMESGMHVDFPTLRKVGASALMVAILGTFMPMILGIGFAAMLGFDAFPDGLAMGAVLAPTSVGIALKLLHEANVLNSVFGQTIVTAAFTDDIFSLVTLTVLLQLAGGDLTPWGVTGPFVYSAIFMTFTFLIAIFVVPRVVPKLLRLVARKIGQNARDTVHIGLMFTFLGAYTYCGYLIGSHLLGAFVTGVTFVTVPRTLQIWNNEMEVVNMWLLRIFFGATVGFAVPIKELLTLEIFWKGAIVGIFPCILGKVLSGFFSGGRRWVVGWAMVGRGEFAFLVAETLRSTEFVSVDKPFLSTDAFGVSVWALLFATVIAPIAFGIVLASQQRLEEKEDIETVPSTTSLRRRTTKVIASVTSRLFDHSSYQPLSKSKWWISVGATRQDFLLRDIILIFQENDVEVKNFVNEGDDTSDLFSFLVELPDDDSPQLHHSSINRRRTAQSFDDAPRHRPRLRSEHQLADMFFRFDVNILVDRLRTELENAVNGTSTVRITRYDAPATPAVGLFNVNSRDSDEESDTGVVAGDVSL